MEEGANLAKAKTTKDNLIEGGAIMLDQADRTTPSSADIVANSTTMRQSV